MTNTAAAEDRNFIKMASTTSATLNHNGTITIAYDDFVTTCKLNDGPCPDVLKPGASSNGYTQTYAYGNMYTKITTSPDLTIDGTTTTIKNLGYRTVPFCYSTHTPWGPSWISGTPSNGNTSCNISANTPSSSYNVDIRTTRTEPGTHMGTLQIYDPRLGTNAQTAPWYDGVHTFYISYRIKNGVPVPPDTPISCVTRNNTIAINHGTVNPANTPGNTAYADLTITCDENAIVEAQVGDGGPTGSNVTLTNSGTTVISLLGDDNNWGGLKQYNINNTSKLIKIRSVIENAAPGQTSTGHTVLKLIYK